MRQRLKNKAAVTIVETLAVIVILSVLAAVGTKSGDAYQSEYFLFTVKNMEKIREKIIGNPLVAQSGLRSDFGYFGVQGAFPSALTDLSGYWISPYSQIATHDAWGYGYVYSATAVDVGSGGADGVIGSGTGFSSDIELSFNRADFEENVIRVYCVDNEGAFLTNTHIDNVAYTSYGTGPTNLTYDSEGYWYNNEILGVYILAGPLNLRVEVDASYRSDLLGNTDTYIENTVVVYPVKEQSQNNVNIFTLRFPGRLAS